MSLVPTAVADEVTRTGSTVVGDLDGDGSDDVVHLEHRADVDTPRAAVGNEYTVVAVDGRDGSTLWRHVTDRFVRVRSITLQDGAGVLLTSGPEVDTISGVYGFTAGSGVDGSAGAFGADAEAVEVTVLRGDGTVAWTRTVGEGGYAGAAGQALDQDGAAVVARDYGSFVGIVAGPGPDGLLLTVVDRTNTGIGYESATVALVLDGETGEERWRTERTATDAAPRVRVAGDISGDGTDDAVLVDTRDGGGGAVALDGATGTDLWHNPDVPLLEVPYVTPLDDVDGDGLGELVVSSSGSLGEPTPTFLSNVIDGADGRIRFATDAAMTTVVGDATGDGRSELVTTTWREQSTEHRVVDADGATVAGPRAVPDSGELPFRRLLAPVGDVDGDGIVDVAHGRGSTDGLHRTEILSGASLHTLRVSADRELPLGTTLTDVGADMLRVTRHGESVTVALRDGATGEEPWSLTMPLPRPEETGFDAAVATADLDRDQLPDLVVTLSSSAPVCSGVLVPEAGCVGGGSTHVTRTTLALSGSDGRILWRD